MTVLVIVLQAYSKKVTKFRYMIPKMSTEIIKLKRTISKDRKAVLGHWKNINFHETGPR